MGPTTVARAEPSAPPSTGDVRRTRPTAHGPDGAVAEGVTHDQRLFRDACAAELAGRTGRVTTGADARAALPGALAAARSVTTGSPVRVDEPAAS
ncbi:hypothetical protein ACFY30_19585 [Streptomyces sp. NPDC000345]|uniref:hypothetical protein n=1 Tax=Streptomyces sp. NPDC000345 TaxID=3364537 RepID=UPI0036AB9387